MARKRPADEIKVYGLNAAKALLSKRLADARRLYLDAARVPAFRSELQELARKKIAYHVCDEAELEKVSGARHHEGVCVFARAPARPRWREAIERAPPRAVLLGLERVDNPHNLGTILRSAAQFGVELVLTEGESGRLSPATYRTAEGGAEALQLVALPSLVDAAEIAAAEGFAVWGLAGEASPNLFEQRHEGRRLILLGNEAEGLSPELRGACTQLLSIPGTGAVESLNVAAATAIALAECWRQDHRPAQSPRRSGPRRSSPRRRRSG